ncbi:MAG: MgtC/SapB family protein [Oscillospiraceae bacterium]|nr:MgtC/SapB family protein [Oscillospiraceae bacterium]
MERIISLLTTFHAVSAVVRLLLAALLGALIGWERGRHGHVAGLRTHMLVCMGACLTPLISLYCTDYLGYQGDLLRLSAQVISGISFLGVGTIMVRRNNHVVGLTTAACLWAVAIMGIAIGAGFYLGGILCALLTLFTLPVLVNLERKKEQPLSYTRLYAEVRRIDDANRLQEDLQQMGIEFEEYNVCPPHSGTPGCIGIGMSIHADGRGETVRKLRELDYIIYAVTAN